MKIRTKSDDQFARDFADKLGEAIDDQSLTREEAAEMLGIKKAVLYKYLRGDAIPGGNVVQRACQEFGLVLDYRGIRLTPDFFKEEHPKPRPARPLQLRFPFGTEIVRSKRGVRVEFRAREINIKLAR